MDKREYLAKYEIHGILCKAVEALLVAQPEDATTFLGNFFRENNKSEEGNKNEEKGEEAAAPAAEGGIKYAHDHVDCCTSNPESYKVVADIPGVARLVEMLVPPGGEDQPHSHPSHALYFVTDAKLSIKDMDADGNWGEPHEAAPPAGAAPIFPAGVHQVKNIGDKEARAIFVEPYPDAKPSGETPSPFKAPFEECGDCYKILAQDDDWITGIVEMEPGAEDTLHQHRDHLIYVLAGDEITIYPNGNKEDPNVVPIKPFAGLPAPIAAGAIFNNHSLKNSGSVPLKMVFFERKK